MMENTIAKIVQALNEWNLPERIDKEGISNDIVMSLGGCVNQEFEVVSDRPRTTKGKIYKIFRIIENDDFTKEYWFYDDRDQPSCIYINEIKLLY